jgi:hypothetical protein
MEASVVLLRYYYYKKEYSEEACGDYESICKNGTQIWRGGI